jgi:parvulin-like peptidyl-prolyl isomerase
LTSLFCNHRAIIQPRVMERACTFMEVRMTVRQVIRPIQAIMAALLVTMTAFAQTPPPPPKSPPPAGSISTTVQIIPVSITNDSVAATVNGEKIFVGEARKILEQRPYPITLTEEQKKQLRQAALEVIIDDVLLRQYLSRQVKEVNQELYKKEVAELQDMLTKLKKDFKTFVTESGQTEEQLQRDMVARVQWKMFLELRYPEANLKQYYDANKPHFDQVLVKASHILIKLPAKHTKEQRDQAMNQLQVWRQEIVAGKAKFEDVAKQHSQCPSKDKGGDIGEFTYKFVVVPEFARAAFSTQKGSITDVVQSVFGLHLILVTDRTAGTPSNYDKMKDQVREVWALDEELQQRIQAEFRKASEIKIMLP